MNEHAEKIVAEYIGDAKIQPLRVIRVHNGKFVLIYKEGKKTQRIECDDRNVLDQILVEFGGKNPETCKTKSRFLDLDGSWDSGDLRDLGHRITQIRICGGRIINQRDMLLKPPPGCGYPITIQSKRSRKDRIKLRMVEREDLRFTRSFQAPKQFDDLVKWIKYEDAISGLRWRVERLHTESIDSGRQCSWKRVLAGDGTKRMVLELRRLDGVIYTRCIRQDLFDAAGDMFDAPCKRVKIRKAKLPERPICLFAAEDGKINLEAYEAAV